MSQSWLFKTLQADIAPLMASLIGVPIPVNSVVSIATLSIAQWMKNQIWISLKSLFAQNDFLFFFFKRSILCLCVLRVYYLYYTWTTAICSKRSACTPMLCKYWSSSRWGSVKLSCKWHVWHLFAQKGIGWIVETGQWQCYTFHCLWIVCFVSIFLDENEAEKRDNLVLSFYSLPVSTIIWRC